MVLLLISLLVTIQTTLPAVAQEGGTPGVRVPSTITVLENSRGIEDAYESEAAEAEPATGSTETVAPIEGAIPKSIVKTFLATAYCLKGQTASGVVVRRGIIAADPRVLPLGSVVRIQAGRYSGIYTVMDTGKLIRGRRVDIYLPTRAEAMSFGAREVKIEVLRHGWDPEPQPLGKM